MTLSYWTWLVLAAILGVLEAVVPGFVLLWVGVAAAIVGCAVWLWPALPVTAQILLFACLSVATILVWLRFGPREKPDPAGVSLNRRAESLVGRKALVVDPIVLGRGRVKVGDSTWAASGPDAQEGSEVTIIGNEGTVLIVEPANAVAP